MIVVNAALQIQLGASIWYICWSATVHKHTASNCYALDKHHHCDIWGEYNALLRGCTVSVSVLAACETLIATL